MSTTTISVRTNLYLWLLTGRSDDFTNPALNLGIGYRTGKTPAEVVSMRELLRLDDTSSDFYVLGALAAVLMSTPFVRTLPIEKDSVFQGGLLQLPTISSSETMLPPDAASWPSINGERAGREGFTQVTFTYLTPAATIMSFSNGVEVVTYHTLSVLSGGGYRLHFAKAAEYGIRADFQVSAWAAASTVVVNLAPTRYPYADFVRRINVNSVALRLMTTEGTMQAYSELSNPAQKTGMLALAIIRRMIRQINEGQAGFEVTSSLGSDLSRVYSVAPTLTEYLNDPEESRETPVGFNV